MSEPAPQTDPIARFQGVLASAHALDRVILPEPTAFALATAGAEGRPSVRILLLKSAGEEGFVFYTNLRSRKGSELRANPWAALCFHWQPLEQQVRVEGPVSPVDDATADAYFASRPRGSQIGAWASLQSEAMETDALDRRIADFERRFDGQPVPRPPHWSGFVAMPERIEFWRGKPNRLHERHLYLREGAGWRLQVLYP